MATKESLTTNKYGQALLSSDHLRELLLQGKNIGHLVVERDRDIELYEEFQSELLKQKTIFTDPPAEIEEVESFHLRSAEEWIFPEIYQTLDVRKHLLDKCTTQEQINRVNEEYVLYEERDLIMLLRLFIYLVSYMRENKMVWGVGRGSSVSSYILFLIGVHRVDSLRYQFDIKDYLK
jgi:DNA polymerase III alpha subunit